VNSASAHTPLAAAAIVAITTPTVDSDAMRHPRPRIVIKLGRELTVLLAREFLRLSNMPENASAKRNQLAFEAQVVLPAEKRRKESMKQGVLALIERYLGSLSAEGRRQLDSEVATLPPPSPREQAPMVEPVAEPEDHSDDPLAERITRMENVLDSLTSLLETRLGSVGDIIRGALAEHLGKMPSAKDVAACLEDKGNIMGRTGGILAILGGSDTDRYPNKLFQKLNQMEDEMKRMRGLLATLENIAALEEAEDAQANDRVIYYTMNRRMYELVDEEFYSHPHVGVAQSIPGALALYKRLSQQRR
jgi:hypothetical protein